MSAPSSGAGPATRPGVRENQVGTPGKRTGPCGVSTVSKKPTAFRCGIVEQLVGGAQRRGGYVELAEQRPAIPGSCAR